MQGTDFIASTLVGDKVAREIGSHKRVQEMIELLLGPLKWEIEKDCPCRAAMLYGIKNMLKEGLLTNSLAFEVPCQ